MKAVKSLVIAACALTVLSCGGVKDSDKVGNAQLCLDELGLSATSADVAKCTELVDGLTSSGAEGIRCAGGFIREGFANPKRYTDALAQIQSSSATATDRQAMMGLMSFGSAGNLVSDYSNISATFQSCLASGGKGSTLLSSFSFFTLGLVRFLSAKGFCATTPAVPITLGGYKVYDFAGCVGNAGGLPVMTAAAHLVELANATSVDADALAAQNAIGAVIIATNTVSCSGTTANVELCTLLSSSITAAGGTTNPRAVAVQFFSKIL